MLSKCKDPPIKAQASKALENIQKAAATAMMNEEKEGEGGNHAIGAMLFRITKNIHMLLSSSFLTRTFRIDTHLLFFSSRKLLLFQGALNFHALLNEVLLSIFSLFVDPPLFLDVFLTSSTYSGKTILLTLTFLNFQPSSASGLPKLDRIVNLHHRTPRRVKILIYFHISFHNTYLTVCQRFRTLHVIDHDLWLAGVQDNEL